MSPRLILSSGCNNHYYPQMHAYMKSVQENNTLAETYLVGVGWDPPNEMGFTGVHLPTHQAKGRGDIWCVQYGDFIHAIPGDDSDVIVFTDGGDVTMQRDFSPEEADTLLNLQTGEVWVGWNRDQNDTLLEEAPRLGFRKRVPTRYNDLSFPVYNTGVIAGTRHTFRLLSELYIANWQVINATFIHYAKMQWLISWAIGTHKDLRAKVMPKTFHAHGHYEPTGCDIIDGKAYYEGDLVLFRHRL